MTIFLKICQDEGINPIKDNGKKKLKKELYNEINFETFSTRYLKKKYSVNIMKLFDGIDQINEYLSEAIQNDNVELELIFGSRVGDNPLDKKIFMKLLENCKTQYRMIKESTDLDIRQEYKNNPSNVRATIHGLDNIKKYCKNEKLDEIENIEYVQKQSYNDSNGNPFRPLRDEDFNVRTNLKKVKLHDRHNYVCLSF